MNKVCHYLDVINILEIFFWLFQPCYQPAYRRSRQSSNLTPNGLTREDPEAALVREVPEALPKHCLPSLHKSCLGALAFQPVSSRLVFATITTTQWEQPKDYAAGVKANSSGKSDVFVAFFSNKVRVSVPCKLVNAFYSQDGPEHMACICLQRARH